MNFPEMSSAWHVTIHDRLEPLRADWEVIESHGCATVFQSFDWLSVWYDVTQSYGVADPIIITAKRSVNGPIELILPLCRVRRYGFSLLTFPDLMVSDFAGPVFMPSAFTAENSFASFWRELRKRLPSDDAIQLSKICTDIDSASNPLLSLPSLKKMPYGLWGLPLEPGTPGASRLVPAAMLASVEKRRAIVRRKFVRSFSWSDDGVSLSQAFAELVEMRRLRCERIGRNEILDDPMWLEFYSRLAERKHAVLKPIIMCLQANGQTIATLFGVGYKGAFHYLLPTFLMQKWSRYTPGFQLLIDSMETCSARGYRYFDLTVGDEPYKQQFGAEFRPLYEYFAPLSSRGWLLYGIWRSKRWLQRHPALLARIKAALGHRLRSPFRHLS